MWCCRNHELLQQPRRRREVLEREVADLRPRPLPPVFAGAIEVGCGAHHGDPLAGKAHEVLFELPPRAACGRIEVATPGPRQRVQDLRLGLDDDEHHRLR